MSGMGLEGLYFNKHPAGHANRQASWETLTWILGCPKGWTVSSVIFLLEAPQAMACVSLEHFQNFNLQVIEVNGYLTVSILYPPGFLVLCRILCS